MDLFLLLYKERSKMEFIYFALRVNLNLFVFYVYIENRYYIAIGVSAMNIFYEIAKSLWVSEKEEEREKERKKEIDAVKQDVAILKQDVAVLKKEINGIKQDVNTIKEGIEKLLQRNS